MRSTFRSRRKMYLRIRKSVGNCSRQSQTASSPRPPKSVKNFKDVVNGFKTFELRKFDDFKKGDEIFLSVYEHGEYKGYEHGEYKGYGAIYKITYILSDCPSMA